MSLSVRERIEMYDGDINSIKKRQAQIIADETPTFVHLPKPWPKLSSRERYVIVYADGSTPRLYPFTQRPAALAAARSPGRYIWDTREDVVLDHKGEVVYRRDSRP